MKTSELIGPALDWAVAECEGFKYIHPTAPWENKHGACGGAQVMVSNKKGTLYDFCPSTNWAHGGPIIGREKIGLFFDRACGNQWRGHMLYHEDILGPTPLIAAMRCYVASKLGDEVEVPEELK
jgi:hypothetical protein